MKEEIISWIKTIVCALIVSLIVTNVIIVNAEVPTPSMEKTIMVGDRLIANRLAYFFDEPSRYDVVIFKWPDNENDLYVKRIIGLPGETVEIIDGKVYIDGGEIPLSDDFINDDELFTSSGGPYKVPEGKYFMMGDNRNHSSDSREWKNKYVEQNKILGKVSFRYYPSFQKF